MALNSGAPIAAKTLEAIAELPDQRSQLDFARTVRDLRGAGADVGTAGPVVPPLVVVGVRASRGAGAPGCGPGPGGPSRTGW